MYRRAVAKLRQWPGQRNNKLKTQSNSPKLRAKNTISNAT
jgi:hypothetical protein